MNFWLQGFQLALSGANLFFLLLGTCIGLIVGVIPVVGPSFGVTLALPFTSGMDSATAVILLAAIQSSAAYGDSIASILINVPGGPGTVASMWEGYPMTRKGKAGTALGVATGASFIGGLLGWFSFVLLAAPMTAFALMIGAPEYFVLGIAALALISIASRGETLRGLIMGCMGLLFGMMGPDPVSGVTYRFSFGIAALEPGIDIALGALAIFALPQLVTLLEQGGTIARVAEVKDSVLGGVMQALRRPRSLIRGGIIGWLIGVLPALGTSAAGVSSYLIEKKFSKERDQFGQGSVDGLTAAEVGKGACVLGDGITSLLLGVPGSVTWAILMAALIVHGIQPGPRFMTAGVLPYTVFAGLLLSQLMYFVIGILLVKQLIRIVHVPTQILVPIVAILCFLGAYVTKNYVFDIWIMVVLGVFALAAERNGYPPVPMILGFILADLIEANFHRAISIGFGSYAVFFKRPISLVMIVLVCLFVARPWAMEFHRHRREGSRKTTEPLSVKLGEFYFGGIVTVILLTFLFSSLRYSSEVRLFPVIVSITGLVLMGYWLLTTMSAGKIKQRRPEDIHSAVGVPAVLGVGSLGVYAMLVPAAGFITASMIFFVLVTSLSHSGTDSKRWKMVSVLTIAIGLFLLSFQRLLQINLPTGLLW
jgi:putative tricarboxylic transport membrane protein